MHPFNFDCSKLRFWSSQSIFLATFGVKQPSDLELPLSYMADRDQVRTSFGIFAHSWNGALPTMRAAWMKKCTAMVASMMVCSMCGTVVFPYMTASHHHVSLVSPAARHAPAAIANMHLRDHVLVMPSTLRRECRWYIGYDCKQHGDHSKYMVRHRPQEMQQLLATSPVEVQLLAFLQVSTVLGERMRGFAHGMVDVHTLIRHPLVSWNVHQEESNYEPSQTGKAHVDGWGNIVICLCPSKPESCHLEPVQWTAVSP